MKKTASMHGAEAAVFLCRLCCLWAFPFISLIVLLPETQSLSRKVVRNGENHLRQHLSLKNLVGVFDCLNKLRPNVTLHVIVACHRAL